MKAWAVPALALLSCLPAASALTATWDGDAWAIAADEGASRDALLVSLTGGPVTAAVEGVLPATRLPAEGLWVRLPASAAPARVRVISPSSDAILGLLPAAPSEAGVAIPARAVEGEARVPVAFLVSPFGFLLAARALRRQEIKRPC